MLKSWLLFWNKCLNFLGVVNKDLLDSIPGNIIIVVDVLVNIILNFIFFRNGNIIISFLDALSDIFFQYLTSLGVNLDHQGLLCNLKLVEESDCSQASVRIVVFNKTKCLKGTMILDVRIF